jgi:metal-responsive CopG/Arc/MetJ family transcriptional regulator
MEKQNVTLSLPVGLLQKLRVMAAKRNVSMSSLMTSAISKLILSEDDYDARAKRAIERMKNAPNRGVGDKITWTREEVHDRVR